MKILAQIDKNENLSPTQRTFLLVLVCVCVCVFVFALEKKFKGAFAAE